MRWHSTVRGPGRGTDEWLATALTAIRTQYTASERYAGAYYTLARRLAAPTAPAFTPERPAFDEDAVVASLVASGFQLLSDAVSAGDTLEQALDKAATSAVGVASRQVLAGGRRMLIDSTERDRLAVGYMRLTRPGCCAFCAMLASRGLVYRGDSFDASDPRFIGEGDVKVHNHCQCSMMAVFARGEALPDLNRQFQDLWSSEIQRKFSGAEARRQWRRLYEARYLAPALSSTAAP